MQERLWGKMQSLFLSDEEMGKKDDDHKPAGGSSIAKLKGAAWAPAAPRVPPRKTLRRALILLAVAAALYLFVRNIPTDVGIHDRRRPVYLHPGASDGSGTGAGEQAYDLASKVAPLTRPKPLPPAAGTRPKPHGGGGGGHHTGKTKEEYQKGTEGDAASDDDGSMAAAEDGATAAAVYTYNGPVRFLNLAPSLYAIASTRGGSVTNKNVLFAAASLRSAATLLPVACQMGAELRSYVHFALMSRSEIDLDELQQINGIDESCQIIFHDARPDYSTISTNARMENSVTRAMYHVQMYMHPQAIIVDGSSAEEEYFSKAMRDHTRATGTSLIELPHNGAQKLSWMTKLDSASLAEWSKVSVDILIHAYPGASGSLIRLLKSLSAADFTACSIPHLTIELPQVVDGPTEKFLETFRWPPAHVPNPSNVRQLSLRHRIPQHGVGEDESSVRFLESFWPAGRKNSHVLVLSPQVELSRNFFHYLVYALLEYRYSNAALVQEWDKRLFGISLELPTTHLEDSSKPFSPPLSKVETQKEATSSSAAAASQGAPISFLWQAPNSNAALFLGERWVELHDFVSRVLEAEHEFREAGQTPPEVLSQKLVSKRHPAWLEQALRLCRARGFWTLYPGAATASHLATVHNELYRPPEEYERELVSEDGRLEGGRDDELALAQSGSLLETLPGGGVLAPFSDLPLLSWRGKETSLADFNAEALAYAADFRRSVGRCDAAALGELPHETLFCLPETP